MIISQPTQPKYIIVKNPRFTTIGGGLTTSHDINVVQVARLIEKALLSKSIIAEVIIQ